MSLSLNSFFLKLIHKTHGPKSHHIFGAEGSIFGELRNSEHEIKTFCFRSFITFFSLCETLSRTWCTPWKPAVATVTKPYQSRHQNQRFWSRGWLRFSINDDNILSLQIALCIVAHILSHKWYIKKLKRQEWKEFFNQCWLSIWLLCIFEKVCSIKI